MNKTALLCILLLALFASTASAATSGLNLAWTSCRSDGGPLNRDFACNQNSGANVLVGSYVPPVELPALNGNEITIDIISAGAGLPAWWQFKNSGTCRQTSLSINFSAPFSAVHCIDAWASQASGGIGTYTIGYLGDLNRAQIRAAVALPPPATVDIPQGQDTFSMTLAINNLKTVGTGACSGCATSVCIVLTNIKLTQPAGFGDYLLTTPQLGNYVSWQGGAVGGSACPAATRTRNTTWGAVKSLYL